MRQPGAMLIKLMFVLSVFLIFSGYWPGPALAEEVTLVVGEWPPYTDSKADNKGFLSEIVQKSYEKAGVSTKIDFMPWARVENLVDNGERLSFGYIKNEERLRKWRFSDSIAKSGSVFAARKKDGITWKTLEDAKPYRIGVTLGYSYGDAFDQFKPQLKIQTAYTDRENFMKLLNGQIDLFAIDQIVGAMLLRMEFPQAERNLLTLIENPPIVSYGMHVICAKNDDKGNYLIDKFNQGLAVLTREGEKERIITQVTSF